MLKTGNTRRVLLTGALGSLGRAQAQGLASQGYHLLLVDRPELSDDGHAFARALGNAVFDGFDLDATGQLRRRYAEQKIDILINNAALILNRPWLEVSQEDYEQQIRINSSAAFALSQAVAPHMMAQAWGRIINFCSLTLNGQWPGYTPYVASKGALFGLTKNLARELGSHGVTVNAISPGAVVSAAEQRVFGDRLAAYEDWVLTHQCLKSRIQPEHVADLVGFLASDAAAMITGQNIGIDGGW